MRVIASQKLPRDIRGVNFCREASRCLAGPSGLTTENLNLTFPEKSRRFAIAECDFWCSQPRDAAAALDLRTLGPLTMAFKNKRAEPQIRPKFLPAIAFEGSTGILPGHDSRIDINQ